MKLLVAIFAIMIYQSAFSGDISLLSHSPGQTYSRTIDPNSISEKNYKIFVGYERINDVKLLDKAELYGSGSKIHFGFRSSLFEFLDIGFAGNLIYEDRVSSNTNIELPSQSNQYVLDLRMKLISSDAYAIGITAFLESGYGQKHHYLFNSKSRAGSNLSLAIGPAWLELISNIYLRYRPVDLHNDFRLSHDLGYSGMIQSQLGPWILFAELASQNTQILKISQAREGYSPIESQQHTIGAHYNIAGSRLTIFAKKAIKDKIVGAPRQDFGFQFSIPIGEKRATTPLEPLESPEMESKPTPILIDPIPLKPQQPIEGNEYVTVSQKPFDNKEYLRKNSNVGHEMDGFSLLEEGSSPIAKRPSVQALIDRADESLDTLMDVGTKIHEEMQINFDDHSVEDFLPDTRDDVKIEVNISH